MYALSTPKEIISKLAEYIEQERKKQRLQQKELASKASIPLPTYKNFIYQQKISLENLLKLLFALKLFDNIEGLLHQRDVTSLLELKHEEHLPKRVRK